MYSYMYSSETGTVTSSADRLLQALNRNNRSESCMFCRFLRHAYTNLLFEDVTNPILFPVLQLQRIRFITFVAESLRQLAMADWEIPEGSET